MTSPARFLGPPLWEVLSGPAVPESRYRRAGYASNAAPLPPGCDRASAPGGSDSRRHQRYRRKPGACRARGDPQQHHVHGRPGARQPHRRGACLDDAGVRLPEPSNREASAGEARGTECLDEGIRRSQRGRVPGLLARDAGRQGDAAQGTDVGRSASQRRRLRRDWGRSARFSAAWENPASRRRQRHFWLRHTRGHSPVSEWRTSRHLREHCARRVPW